jgi:hypothetical protein
MTIACQTCKTEFRPRRSTARFCSPRCRLIGHRNGCPLVRSLAYQASYLARGLPNPLLRLMKR